MFWMRDSLCFYEEYLKLLVFKQEMNLICKESSFFSKFSYSRFKSGFAIFYSTLIPLIKPSHHMFIEGKRLIPISLLFHIIQRPF